MIKVIHYGLSTNQGGIETYLHKLYTHIDKDQFAFDFINFNSEAVSFYDEFQKMGAHFHDILPRKKSFIKNIKMLDDLFKEKKFDILHCHFNTLSDIAPVCVALKNNCQVIVHSRSSNVQNRHTTQVLHKINYLLLPKNKIKKLAVSDLAGQWLFGEKSSYEVINNGIDLNRFVYSEKTRVNYREKLGIQEDEIVLGHVGVFLPVKNHEFILEVFAEFKEMHPKSKLLLVGDGPLKTQILNQISKLNLNNDVFILSNRKDVEKLLSAMDLFIFPSFYEGFGSAGLEAQATGLPCVISDRVPEDVMVLQSCQKKSLDLEPRIWAHTLSNLNINDNRIVANQKVKKAGYSVEEEVIKIEKVYKDLMKQSI